MDVTRVEIVSHVQVDFMDLDAARLVLSAVKVPVIRKLQDVHVNQGTNLLGHAMKVCKHAIKVGYANTD